MRPNQRRTRPIYQKSPISPARLVHRTRRGILVRVASPKERRDRGPSAPPVSGFNHYSTSDTRTSVSQGKVDDRTGGTSKRPSLDDGIFVIDRAESRNRRVRSGVITAARLINEQASHGGRRPRVAFLTLTYARVDDWRPTHFLAFAKCVREWCRRRGCKFRYVFKAELQQRGAVHYHVLVWLPKGVTLPKPDKQGWWKHGHTRIERVVHNAVAYIAKYAAKEHHAKARFPRGCRLHGSGGLTGEGLHEKRWWALPTWAREKFTISDRPVRAVGGGVVSRETGDFHSSPFIVCSTGQGKVSIMKRDGTCQLY